MRVERLDRLRVVEGAVDAATARRTDHERHAEVAVGPVAHAGCLGDDLIEGGVDEVGELDLGDRQQPVQRHADRHADDAGFGERRIDDAPLAELVEEPLRHLEDTPAGPDVLTEEHDPIVGGELVVQRVTDRGDEVLLAHGAPSKNTCRVAVSGRGSGASHAAWIARLDLRSQLVVDALDPGVIHEAVLDQVGGEAIDRVVVAVLLDLLAAPVRLVVVVGGVRQEPVRLALDQGGPVARPGAVVGLLHRRVAPEDVVPVDDDARHAVARRARGDVADRHLLATGGR